MGLEAVWDRHDCRWGLVITGEMQHVVGRGSCVAYALLGVAVSVSIMLACREGK